MVATAAFTDEEVQLYDRQLRLWGSEAQARLKASRVLLVGLSGLGAEVAKNLMLAGIKSLTLMDDATVTEEDNSCQFFIPREALGENRAEASAQRCQTLNPLVSVTVEKCGVLSKPDEYFKDFDIVCIIDQPPEIMTDVNNKCRKVGNKFCAGGTRGYIGFCFMDFGPNHKYADETIVKATGPTDEGESIALDVDSDDELEPGVKRARMEQDRKRAESGSEQEDTNVTFRNMSFTTMESAMNTNFGTKSNLGKGRRQPPAYFIMRSLWSYEAAEGKPLILTPEDVANPEKSEAIAKVQQYWDKELEEAKVKPDAMKVTPQEFSEFCIGKISPVCAIVGGVLGQEVIKGVSEKDEPLNNFFFFNGMNSTGIVTQLPPPGPNRK